MERQMFCPFAYDRAADQIGVVDFAFEKIPPTCLLAAGDIKKSLPVSPLLIMSFGLLEKWVQPRRFG
jgi:hypothetical protein